MLFNQHWISPAGDPVTGRAPTRMVIHAPPGVVVNAGQLGGAAHAYKVFCDAVNASPIPGLYHVQNRTLSDGSKLRLESNQDVHTVTMWIGGEHKNEPTYRGFVIKPKSTDAPGFTYPKIATLLQCTRDSGGALVWSPWVVGYNPGKNEPNNTYFVDTKKTKYTRAVAPLEDARYFDVYSFDRTKLLLNGRQGLAVPALTKSPIKIGAGTVESPTTWFSVSDSRLERIAFDPVLPPTLSELWARIALEPALWETAIKPGYKPGASKIEYTDYYLLLTTWYVRRISHALLTSPPWITGSAVFTSYAAAPRFVPTGGWAATDYPIATSSPLRPNTEPESYWMGSSGGKMYANSVGTNDFRTQLDYIKNLTDTFDVPLYDGITATVTRDVDLVAHRTNGIVNWFNVWNAGVMWNSYIDGAPPDWGGVSYVKFPRDFSGTVSHTYAGNLFNLNMQEGGGDLALDETATSEITVSSPGDCIKTLYRAQIVRSLNQIETTHSMHVYRSTWIGAASAPYGLARVFLMAEGWDPAEVVFDNKTELTTFDCIARDYILADTVNGVFVYLESTLTGGSSDYINYAGGGSASTGGWTLEIEMVVEFADETVRHPIKTATGPEQLYANTWVPDDITQIAFNRTIKYSSPFGAIPLFAPLWFDQGGCPYVAYTTLAERSQAPPAIPDELTAADRLKKFVMSLQFRLLVRNRPLFATPAAMPGVEVSVYPDMLEQMFINHWPGIAFYRLAEIIEATPYTINVAKPSGDIHAALGITDANPSSHYYRT